MHGIALKYLDLCASNATTGCFLHLLLPGALSLYAAGVVLHVALPDAGLALLSLGLELEVLLVGELAAAAQLAVQQLVLHLLVILAGQVAPAQQQVRSTLQIILDLCIPEKELAKTRSQISFI
jgi:hypothetical protein